MQLIKWPSIEQFRHIYHNILFRSQYTGKTEDGQPILDTTKQPQPLPFKGTVKLHGTNASVCFSPDFSESWIQSREAVLTAGDTHFGFVAFEKAIHTKITELVQLLVNASPEAQALLDKATAITVFGEWAGKGVQKKCAIHQVDKFFAIFGVGICTVGEERNEFYWIPDEQVVSGFKTLNGYRVFHVDQFGTHLETFDFSDPEKVLDRMNELTQAVEKECPAGKFFGVTGIGEGIVWRCTEPGYLSPKFWVKIKGDEHKVAKVKNEIQIDPEETRSIEEMLECILPEARLEQGLSILEAKYPQVMLDHIGEFLKWVSLDVWKEEKDRIEASELDTKKITKAVQQKAKTWYMAEVKPF